jgi:hypothetical protein
MRFIKSRVMTIDFQKARAGVVKWHEGENQRQLLGVVDAIERGDLKAALRIAEKMTWNLQHHLPPDVWSVVKGYQDHTNNPYVFLAPVQLEQSQVVLEHPDDVELRAKTLASLTADQRRVLGH